MHGPISIHTSKTNDIIHALRQKIFAEMYPGMNEKDNPAIAVKIPEDRCVKLAIHNLDGVGLAMCRGVRVESPSLRSF